MSASPRRSRKAAPSQSETAAWALETLTYPKVERVVHRIGTPAESVAASCGVLVLPSQNPSVGSILEVTGLESHGWFLELRDPAGYRVWWAELVGVGAEPLGLPR